MNTNVASNALNIATVYKNRPHVVVFVQPTGKIRESKSELLGSIKDLVLIQPDQRLKPENQAADLQKKLDRFIDDIGDKFQLVDQQLSVAILDYSGNSPVEGGSFLCYASDFSSKLATVFNKLSIGILARNETTPVLLIGPYVTDTYRSVMRHIVKSGMLPTHPLDYCDVMSTLLPSAPWEQLTEVARKQCYYGDQTPQQFYLHAFKSIYDWTPADSAVIAEYGDKE